MKYAPFFYTALIFTSLFFQIKESDSKEIQIPSLKAETSHFLETGRLSESNEQCKRIANVYPKKAKCLTISHSPEGREMKVLIVSGKNQFNEKLKGNTPVLWVQAGIHAGEIEGKDAGFIFIKNALKENASWLNHFILIFCPIINIDGHERFGKWNRPNQAGPLEMGWRVNSENLNLNRDYMKLDSTEISDSLKFLTKWDPTVWVDLHTTDGAEFQHDVAVILPSVQNSSGLLQTKSVAFQNSLMKGLSSRQHLPLYFYPEFKENDQPLSGIEHYPGLPKMGYEYWSLRNRIGILVETHSWKTYKERTKTMEDVLEEITSFLEKEGTEIVKAEKEADSQKWDNEIPLTWKVSEKFKTIDFLGYAYQIQKSDVSNQNWIQYDSQKKQTWKIPIYDDFLPDFKMKRPKFGYYIEPSFSALVEKKCIAHGINFEKVLKEEWKSVEVFRAKEVTFSTAPSESHWRAKWVGEWVNEKQWIKKGSLFIPSSQPRIRLAMLLLEPGSPDSLSSWGFFNAFAEQKEYVEDYVLEVFAREKLKDPRIKLAFDQKLKEEAFQKSPEKRLQFFYEMHPAFDEHFRRLPLFRE